MSTPIVTDVLSTIRALGIGAGARRRDLGASVSQVVRPLVRHESPAVVGTRLADVLATQTVDRIAQALNLIPASLLTLRGADRPPTDAPRGRAFVIVDPRRTRC
jgi:hypothetical protein